MQNVPKSWLQEEIDDIENEPEQNSTDIKPNENIQVENIVDIQEPQIEPPKPKEQQLVNIHIKMDRENQRETSNKTTLLTSLNVTKDEGFIKRANVEEEKESIDKDSSKEQSQMTPAIETGEDSMLSISYED